MRKPIFFIVALTLVITAGSFSTNAQAVMGFRSPLPAFASSTVQTNSNPLTAAISVATSLTAHPSSWFSTFGPSRSLMLVVGGCLLLFGAFLRRRAALRRPQNRPAEVREVHAKSEMNRTLDDSRIGDHIEPPSPHVVSPSNERSTQGTLPVFLAAQRVTADQAVSKES
jgi:hypothetical protein